MWVGQLYGREIVSSSDYSKNYDIINKFNFFIQNKNGKMTKMSQGSSGCSAEML